MYYVFRSDRDFVSTNISKGGGVLLALKQDLNVIKMDIPSIYDKYCQLKMINILICKINLINMRI